MCKEKKRGERKRIMREAGGEGEKRRQREKSKNW